MARTKWDWAIAAAAGGLVAAWMLWGGSSWLPTASMGLSAFAVAAALASPPMPPRRP